MTLFDQARAIYDREPCARRFDEDLNYHLNVGYVVSTPTAFAMVRPVWKDWPYERLTSPWITAGPGDCWWIWLLAGDLKTAMRWLPHELPWIGYERQNVPRFYRCADFGCKVVR